MLFLACSNAAAQPVISLSSRKGSGYEYSGEASGDSGRTEEERHAQALKTKKIKDALMVRFVCI